MGYYAPDGTWVPSGPGDKDPQAPPPGHLPVQKGGGLGRSPVGGGVPIQPVGDEVLGPAYDIGDPRNHGNRPTGKAAPGPPFSPTARPATTSAQTTNAATTTLVEGPVAPVAVNGGVGPAFGKFRVEGSLLFQQVGDVISANFAIGWCAGGAAGISSIDKVFLNDVDYTSISGVSFTHYLGAYTQSVEGWLSALGYTSRYPGTTWSRVYATGSGPVPQWRLLFAGNGLTKAAVEGTGWKVYDPRLDSTVPGGSGAQRNATASTWTYSNNPALCLRAWLTDAVDGAGAAQTQIDDASFMAAATYCDAAVSGKPRWSANGVIVDGGGESVKAQLLTACDGDLFLEKGKYKLVCNQVAGSPVLALDTRTNCREVEYVPRSSRDMPTRVTVKFQNRNKNWTADQVRADHPGLATGGVELRETVLDLALVKDEEQAARIAVRRLNRELMNLRVTCIASFVGIQLTRGSLFTLTTSDGLAAQNFTVLDFERLTTGEYKISGLQYAATLYDEVAITVDSPPSTSFPTNTATVDDVAFGVFTASPGSIYWKAPRSMSATTYTAAGTSTPGATSTMVDCGVAVKCGKVDSWLTAGAGRQLITGVEWSDDNSAWTAVSGFVECGDYAQWTNTYSRTYEWTTPTAAHRYWRVTHAGASLGNNAYFYVVVLESDPDVVAYEIYNGTTKRATVGVTKYSDVPLWKTIPAVSAPTSTNPLGLIDLIQVYSGFGYLCVRVVAVRANGLRSAGPQGGYYCTTAAAGQAYAALQGTGLVAQSGGTAIDGMASSGVVEITAAAGSVSSASKAKLDISGGVLRGSVNTDAFSKILRLADANAGASANKVVLYDASGYLLASYLNTTADDQAQAKPYRVLGRTSGDTFGRWFDPVQQYSYVGLTLSTGANQNVALPAVDYSIIGGPGGAFSIGGIVAPSSPNARRLILRNATVQTFTINHQDAGSTSANRIYARTGANVTVGGNTSIVVLVYDFNANFWLIESVTNY